MFLPHHALFPYYVSGYALVLVERLFAKGILRHKEKRFKDHLLMLSRIMAVEKGMPSLDDKKRVDEYSASLLEILANDDSATALFGAAQTVIEKALKETKYNKQEAHRLRAFTAELVAMASKGKDAAIASTKKVRGTVKWFSDVRGYGFIGSSEGDLFVHARDVVGTEDRMVPGVEVEFTVMNTPKGRQAVVVEFVENVGV